MAANQEDLPQVLQYKYLLDRQKRKKLNPSTEGDESSEEEVDDDFRFQDIYLTKESMENQMPILWGCPKEHF